MAVLPIPAATGDPIAGARASSINAIRRFTSAAADSAKKLNTQERIVSPGDDALAFKASREIRSQIAALKVVTETGQTHVTGLGLAVEGLEDIRTQLDGIKALVVTAQTADPDDISGLQAQIDLALSQIDSTAHNTKLGKRSLLNGESTVHAFGCIVSATGCVLDFSARQNGLSVAAVSGILGVRVNRLGRGGPTRQLLDGRTVLSLNVSLVSYGGAVKAYLSMTPGAAAVEFAEFRITGKLGSATVTFTSDFGATGLVDNLAIVEAFNSHAAETGVVLTSDAVGGLAVAAVGYGPDEFVKIELLSSDGASAIQLGAVSAASAVGTVQTAYGTGGKVNVNGQLIELGGEFGLTARYQRDGFDIEIDLSQFGISDRTDSSAAGIHHMIIDVSQGISGLLGSSGRGSEVVQYGFGNFTTSELGRGSALNTVVTMSGGDVLHTTDNSSYGNMVLGGDAVANLGSGGTLDLASGNFTNAIGMLDRAISQVVNEQTRLGVLQGNFVDAINRAEVGLGNLAAADADILGVDATTEITNLIQAQLGIATATSVLSQANSIQAQINALING